MTQIPSILSRICQAKRAEIEALRKGDLDALRRAAGRQTPPRGFRSALMGEGVALIAEVKKASPSAGLIRQDFDPVHIARAYERGGAACISVLTDERFFQGSLAHLRLVRSAVDLPLLRKDFILDPVQVLEARALGADAYLLIAAALAEGELGKLLAAGRELGMDALVEVHDEGDLGVALEAGADLIGINNRDLRTFQVGLDVTERLAPLVPAGVVVVAESGIRTCADVRRLKACGIRAVLVGEALMRAADIEAATRELASA